MDCFLNCGKREVESIANCVELKSKKVTYQILPKKENTDICACICMQKVGTPH